jgi:glycosyltransferase involved in cell wall biosynthesis
VEGEVDVRSATVDVYGLGLVKNEADVIEESARHALTFCERIYYLDNGSTDGTWEILQRLAREPGGRVVAMGREDVPFHDGLRALIYDEVHHALGPDDWWLQLDADEFLEVDPRRAIANAMALGKNRIRTWQAQFAFTDSELDDWDAGREDRSLPIRARRRWYRADWRESRLWRNDPTRKWGTGSSTHPIWADRPTPFALVNRHYQFRDPVQMQHRIDDRRGVFPHVTSESWRQDVRSAREMRNLDHDGQRIRVERTRYMVARLRIQVRYGGIDGVRGRPAPAA